MCLQYYGQEGELCGGLDARSFAGGQARERIKTKKAKHLSEKRDKPHEENLQLRAISSSIVSSGKAFYGACRSRGEKRWGIAVRR